MYRVPKRNFALAGHGKWSTKDGYTMVPKGTTIVFFGPKGAPITDEFGLRIEEGKDLGRWREEYPPGSMVPNYVLTSPIGLHTLDTSAYVQGGGISGDGSLKLNEILKPNQGWVRWAACRSPVDEDDVDGVQIDHGNTRAALWNGDDFLWGTSRWGGPSELVTPDPAWYDWDSQDYFTES